MKTLRRDGGRRLSGRSAVPAPPASTEHAPLELLPAPRRRTKLVILLMAIGALLVAIPLTLFALTSRM